MVGGVLDPEEPAPPLPPEGPCLPCCSSLGCVCRNRGLTLHRAAFFQVCTAGEPPRWGGSRVRRGGISLVWSDTAEGSFHVQRKRVLGMAGRVCVCCCLLYAGARRSVHKFGTPRARPDARPDKFKSFRSGSLLKFAKFKFSKVRRPFFWSSFGGQLPRVNVLCGRAIYRRQRQRD